MADAREDLLFQFWSALKGASFAMFERMKSIHGDKSPTTGAQMGVLHVLTHVETPLTPQEIARRLDVTPATVTGFLNKMEDAELIERRRDTGDRRVVRVHVSAKGRAMVKKWRETFLDELTSVYAPLSDAELKALTATLARVAPPIVGPPGGFGALLKHAQQHEKPAKASRKKRRA